MSWTWIKLNQIQLVCFWTGMIHLQELLSFLLKRFDPTMKSNKQSDKSSAFWLPVSHAFIAALKVTTFGVTSPKGLERITLSVNLSLLSTCCPHCNVMTIMKAYIKSIHISLYIYIYLSIWIYCNFIHYNYSMFTVYSLPFAINLNGTFGRCLYLCSEH